MSKKRSQLIREYLDENYEGAIILEPQGLDDAIIGISDEGRVVYSYNKLLKAFMKHEGMTYEEAIEWVEYNTMRSLPYMGQQAPVIVVSISELIS